MEGATWKGAEGDHGRRKLGAGGEADRYVDESKTVYAFWGGVAGPRDSSFLSRGAGRKVTRRAG